VTDDGGGCQVAHATGHHTRAAVLWGLALLCPVWVRRRVVASRATKAGHAGEQAC
jgi:hypothetical protein